MFFQSSETCIQDHKTSKYVLLFVHSSNHNAGFRDNSTNVVNPQSFVVCDWKHFHVMRLNPQPSVVFEWKHLCVMRLNPQPSVVWLETLTCNETTEVWGFSLITRRCFQSQTTEDWGFNLITRKCYQSHTTEVWGFSLITRKCFQNGNTYG
jgi:hypothetical protein